MDSHLYRKFMEAGGATGGKARIHLSTGVSVYSEGSGFAPTSAAARCQAVATGIFR